MSKTATRIRTTGLNNMHGDARLYQLSEPLEGHDYVVVSAVDDTRGIYPICETYIFGADSSGHITDWGELPGSFQGDTNHAVALEGAGYEVAA